MTSADSHINVRSLLASVKWYFVLLKKAPSIAYTVFKPLHLSMKWTEVEPSSNDSAIFFQFQINSWRFVISPYLFLLSFTLDRNISYKPFPRACSSYFLAVLYFQDLYINQLKSDLSSFQCFQSNCFPSPLQSPFRSKSHWSPSLLVWFSFWSSPFWLSYSGNGCAYTIKTGTRSQGLLRIARLWQTTSFWR